MTEPDGQDEREGKQAVRLTVAQDGSGDYDTVGAALAALCAHVGAAPEQVVAFGDGYNDLSMLVWAGTGVAMGNADARVKYLADCVAPSCQNAGFWRMVCALGLL